MQKKISVFVSGKQSLLGSLYSYVVKEGHAWNGQDILFLGLFSAKWHPHEDNCDTPAVTEHNHQPNSSNVHHIKWQKKCIPQSTENPLSFSICNYSEKCECVQHGLPGRMQEVSPKLSFLGLLKSSMSILLVQSQDVWWEKFPLFISLKT